MPPLSDMVCSCVFLSATSHRLLVYTVPKMILLVLPHSHVPFPIFKELTLLMSHRFYLNAMHASYMHRSAKPGSRCPLSVRRCPRSGRPRFLKKRNSNTDTFCKFGNFRLTFISRIFYFRIISEFLNSRVRVHVFYKA